MGTHEQSLRATDFERDPRRASDGFERLAARLDSIAARAASERWPDWTDADAQVTTYAAREIRAIPEALAVGMREAFAVGREYGHREERLEEVQREADALSSFLAQQAWGGGRVGLA
ncbi:MAG TPA: hypothetical protein VLA09_11015 [Longimicrobiales bacterium]|nr:hypothetical protein [Longimicrobiales bacterium]